MCGTRYVLIHSASITFILMYIWLYHTCTHQYSKVQSVPPNGIICGHRPNVDRAKKFDAIYCGLCCCSFSIMVWSTYTQRRENKNPVTFDHQILLWQCVIFIKNLASWCETLTLMLCIFSPLPLSKPAQMLHKFGKVDQFLQCTSAPH